MEMKDLDGSDNVTTCTDSSGEDERTTKRMRCRKPQSLYRPNASPGLWLACLLPLAYLTAYLQSAAVCVSNKDMHQFMTVTAIGMAVESFCFFLYLFYDTNIVFKLIISLMPCAFASVLFSVALQWSWTIAISFGIGITLSYQNTYMHIMRNLPHCFTLGEAAILVQGLFLFTLSAILRLFNVLWIRTPLQSDFDKLNIIMLSALLCLLVYCCILRFLSFFRRPLAFYSLSVLLFLAVTCMPIIHPLPIVTLILFLLKHEIRIFIILFYLLLVGLTVWTVGWQIANGTKASTRVRKIFHVLIVLVYLPGIFYECNLLYLATGVAFALFTLVELLRVLEVPPLASKLKNAFAAFKDEKDAGLLALTPFYLLVGCSLPIWLAPCPCSSMTTTTLPMLAGILAVGFGDTAASVIGSKFGRCKWQGSSRTLEGTVAFMAAIVFSVYGLSSLGLLIMTRYQWLFFLIAVFISALVEAFTDQIDNLVLPLIFYIFVNLA